MIDFGLAAYSAPPANAVCVANITEPIAKVVSTRLATLHELDTVLGIEDLWNLIEIHDVYTHNSRVAQEAAQAN